MSNKKNLLEFQTKLKKIQKNKNLIEYKTFERIKKTRNLGFKTGISESAKFRIISGKSHVVNAMKK
jgi:hypothetical protein